MVDGLAGNHLQQHHAEGPDVGAPVDGLAAGLLGAHVGGGAEQCTDGGHRRGDRRGVGQPRRAARAGRVPFERLGQAEVEQLDLAVGGEHHVGRLEIAVDDAAVVSRFEAPRDLERQLQRLL